MRITFTNLGCKLNQSEVDELAQGFLRAGHEIVATLEQADVHVVNSCTVTHVAARDSRKIARRGARRNSRLKTILTGCYVSAEPNEAAALAGVDLVVPNSDKENLVERFHQAFPDYAPSNRPDSPVEEAPYFPFDSAPSRPTIKIEDGCNMRCSFCIIPYTRGNQTSRDPEQIVARVRQLELAGYREVVVTGVQISSYRWGNTGLFELTESILGATQSLRLRLTSIAPWQFDHRILDLFDSGRLCRHFHLSLQSGSNSTLRRMRRPYSTSQFAELVCEVRQAVPGVGLTTDIIVGFPGETRGEFEDSLSFVEQMRFARVHTFPYSTRPGTEAATHREQLPFAVKRQRMAEMLDLAQQSQIDFQTRAVGTEVDVLWEDQKEGVWIGTSDNYLRVTAIHDGDLGARITATQLTGFDGPHLRGRLSTIDRQDPENRVRRPAPKLVFSTERR